MKEKNNNIKFNFLYFVLTLFCFGIILYRTSYLATATTIDGINIKE